MFFQNRQTARTLQSIPVGHYHDVMLHGHPVRRAWHKLKFTRVIEALPPGVGLSILDIGCFAGTFLSLLPESWFARQVGVDILEEQVQYAQEHFGTSYRRYQYVADIDRLSEVEGEFDCVTLIEVIEHLTPEDIGRMLSRAAEKLKPGGLLLLSTPNYASTWPLLEILLNRVSDVTYDEQHITRFTYFNAERRLREIAPVLADGFDLEFKTTTHLIAPFLAVAGVEVAHRISKLVEHRTWKVPVGNLVLMAWRKR